MIYKRTQVHSRIPGGFFSFEEERSKGRLHGFGYGDFVHLRDEFGNLWRGSADRAWDNSVRYIFRDPNGRTISGVADQFGVTLRDERGKSWRGFIE